MADPAPADARSRDALDMAAVADGDRAALGRLMHRHARGIKAVAARTLGSAQDAEEVVQDTFLRAWRHADRYDPARGAVTTWLYRIGVRLAIDRQRRRALRRFVGLEEASIDPIDPAPAAERILAGKDRLAHVRQALLDLPERQRVALLLGAVGEMATAEIADVLGTSRGAAEQLLVRGRKRLRALIEARDAGAIEDLSE
ncbi:MAG: RNA polymerase sigma factor [Paracoccaceae bacterium]